MSFGVSISDLIAVGGLAVKLYEACRGAAPEFQDCASLCHQISLVIEGCRPNYADSVLYIQNEKTISILVKDCNTTLDSLQTLLRKYDRLSSTSHKFRDTLRFASHKGKCDKIRRKLNEHLLMINTWMTGVQFNIPEGTDSVSPELFFALFTTLCEQKSATPTNEPILDPKLTTESGWQALRARVCETSGLDADYLDRKKPYVKACIMKIIQDQDKRASLESGKDNTIAGDVSASNALSTMQTPANQPLLWKWVPDVNRASDVPGKSATHDNMMNGSSQNILPHRPAGRTMQMLGVPQACSRCKVLKIPVREAHHNIDLPDHV